MWDLETHKQTALWDTWDHRFKMMAAVKAAGAPLDYIGEGDDFAAYPFLVAPAYQLVDEALVAKWTRYVEDGGHLVLTCRTGQKTKSGQLPEAPWAGLVAPLIGAEVELFDNLLDDDRGLVRMKGRGYAWNAWADVLKPVAGTETLAVYADQFYAGKPAVVTRKLGRGSVTYIGAATIEGGLERDVMREVYRRAGVEAESLSAGRLRRVAGRLLRRRQLFVAAVRRPGQARLEDRPRRESPPPGRRPHLEIIGGHDTYFLFFHPLRFPLPLGRSFQ